MRASAVDGLMDPLAAVSRWSRVTPAVLNVDLAGVTFLDCTGIHALVAVRNPPSALGVNCRSPAQIGPAPYGCDAGDGRPVLIGL